MKFTKAQIAALVLGYLKSEKLLNVAGEFLKCCQYFEENNIKMGRYFATRVAGMSLVDFLEEYALIYSIVQSRLEETNYYEVNSRTSLVDQLLYLVEKQPTPSSSTPVTRYTNEIVSSSCKTTVSASSEVDTTPAHALPGNCCLESDSSVPKTPKKRSSRSKSKENESLIDLNEVAEVLTQSFMEHQLHEKLADTINIVRNTPEVAKPVCEERISADASKELDAVIKTVVEKTEEDPLYNKIIHEIIGMPETSTSKKSLPYNTRASSSFNPDPKSDETSEKSRTDSTVDPMDDHNNDAIRSIMEVAQNTDSTTAGSKNENGEVYLFDGTLDTYLKSSGAVNTNPLYLNPGLIVVPPPEPSKQFYIVNNQPVLKMTTVLTEKEIMSLPTVIVNDGNPPVNKKNKRPKVLRPKKTEKSKVTGSELIDSISTMESDKVTVVTASKTTPSIGQSPCTTLATTPSLKQASHVRNLDFSTPGDNLTESKQTELKTTETKKNAKAWDADLRQLVRGCKDKSPSPKRKRQKKKKQVSDDENEVEVVDEAKDEAPKTPAKEAPKTPGGVNISSTFHCTPFNDVIDEQLKGVDLSSIPTPSIPITPGFALTPGDLAPYNQRGTDYSSSTYYQPSDNERPPSIEQLIEEGNRSQSPTSNLKILSDVVIEQAKIPVPKTDTTLKKFNNNVIGKKNLSLLKKQTKELGLSETSSDSESEQIEKKANNTAIIKDIISTVEVKSTLEEKCKNFRSELEEVRQRTIKQIKNSKKPVQKPRKPPKKRLTKKKEANREENISEEAKKLVKGLAERGINLIPNKTPQKAKVEEKVVEVDESAIAFDEKTYESYEIVVHDEKNKKKMVKNYDFDICKKNFSVKVLMDDSNEEVTRIMKWTDCDGLLDIKQTSPKRPKTAETDLDDELMDYAIAGSGVEDTSDSKHSSKGGRKRKRISEDENKQIEKKNKFESNIKLLKKIDVDDFLNKVHGE